MLMEASKVRGWGQGRCQIHNAEEEIEAKAKKNCEAELCEADARDAVLTTTTNLNSTREILQ